MARCADGSYFTDTAADVDAALNEINIGSGNRYAKGRRPLTCVYAEECAGAADAEKRMRAIKRLSKADKAELSETFAHRIEYALVELPAEADPMRPAATNAAVRKTMKANKSKNTGPEMLVRRRLRQEGLRGYRLHWNAPGKPDIAWPGKKVCIQIMGCFWHRCPKCALPMPKSHTEYWMVKFERNMQRDERNLRALNEAGWRVHVIWECELKKNAAEATFAELIPKLREELGK